MDRGMEFRFPTLQGWMRNLLIGLFGLYALELILRNAGFPVYSLAWQPLESGFRPWQPLTRYLVQGEGVFGVLMGMLLIYFLLPSLWETVSRHKLRGTLIAGALGGSLLPLLFDLAWSDSGPVMGWVTLTGVFLPTLFGLALPNQTIYLMLAIPVNGRFLLWATAVVSGLLLVFGGGQMSSAEPFGVWSGMYGWWQFLGPGARKRELRSKAASIERELRKFQVIDGGLSGEPQGDQDGRNGGDEWVN